MKAIILCAGQGSRLGKEMPKGLLIFEGDTLINRQIRQYNEVGITDITLVTGYKHEMIKYDNVIYDKEHENHDILGSIMSAREKLEGDVIISYSDIIFDTSDLKELAKSSYNFTILVDENWKEKYQGRINHPVSEADSVVIKNRVAVQFGKGIDESSEFVGVMKLNKFGCQYFKKVYDITNYKEARLLPFLQELTDRNFGIVTDYVKDRWFEIDTLEDYQKALQSFSSVRES